MDPSIIDGYSPFGSPQFDRSTTFSRPMEENYETDVRTEVVKRKIQRERNSSETEDDRNLRRLSYLRATNDWDCQNDEGCDGAAGLKSPECSKSPAIHKFFSVFTKIVDTPPSPTSSGRKSIDFARHEGCIELKIITDKKKSDEQSWKSTFLVLRGQTIFIYKDKISATEEPHVHEEHPIQLNECRCDTFCDLLRKRTVLQIRHESGQEYHMFAESDVAIQTWIQLVEDLCISDSKHLRWARRSFSSRNRSPSSQSPVNKFRKPSTEQSLASPEKEHRRSWRGKMPRPWKRAQNASPTPAQYPEGGSIGVPLEECPSSSEPNSEVIPKLVQVCCSIVEERGLNTVGIYRVPGNSAALMTLTEQVNKGSEHFNLSDPPWSDVNVVSSLLKSFFRKLPDPLFTKEMYSAFIETSRIEDGSKRLTLLRNLVHELPETNFQTLKYICNHFCKVIQHSDVNKMDLRNLSIVLGPGLVRTSDDNIVAMVTDMTHQSKIIESILAHNEWFFATNLSQLPPTLDPNLLDVPLFGDGHAAGEYCQSTYQSLLLNNLQKLEDYEKSTRDTTSAKDLMSGILSAANRKMLRATSSNNKMKKGSVDSSAPGTSSTNSPVTNKPQLWLDLAETGASSASSRRRISPLITSSLLANVPQVFGTLVGGHPSLSTISSVGFVNDDDCHSDECDEAKEAQKSSNSDLHLLDSSNLLLPGHHSSCDNHLMCFAQNTLFQLPARIALNKSIQSDAQKEESSGILSELTTTFDEKLRDIMGPFYQESQDSISMPGSHQGADRRKSALAAPTLSSQESNQGSSQRSLSLDHTAADVEAIQQELQALTVKLRSKKSDLKRGRIVEKSKEPFIRQRSSIINKCDTKVKDPIGVDVPVMEWISKLEFYIQNADNDLKSANLSRRRHTIGGLYDLLTELRGNQKDLDSKTDFGSCFDNPKANFSFANTIQNSYNDQKSFSRLRSSSPDLISINVWSMVEMSEELAPNQF